MRDSVNNDEPSVNRRDLVRSALDKALGIQAPVVEKNIARARQRNPDATPADVIQSLERMYRSALAGTGAAVGATAAVPGVGTAVALTLSGGEVLTQLELTTLFALSLAHIHGVRVDEIERRRTLLFGLLLGGGSSETIHKISGRTGRHWAKHIVNGVPTSTLKQINNVLGPNFITRYGTRQGIIVLGRVVPFGIGAVIGGGANYMSAETMIRASRRAFGPAPEIWHGKVD